MEGSPRSSISDSIAVETQPFIMSATDHMNTLDGAKDAAHNRVEYIESHHDSRGRDKAAQLLRDAGHEIVVSADDNKRILRKIDWAILPIILVIYCLQSLDKTALSYASVFDLIDSTGLVGSQYSWLGSIVYVAQLVWQPFIAFLLVKLPLGKFCGVMVCIMLLTGCR